MTLILLNKKRSMIITIIIKTSAKIKELIKKTKNKIRGKIIERNSLYLKLITFLPFISKLFSFTKTITTNIKET